MLRVGASSANTGLYRLKDDKEEHFFEEYAEHLAALNQIVIASKEKLEGNIFYFHEAVPDDTYPEPKRRHKRRNYSFFVSCGSNLLEVGFNAGHSALLALTSNKSLRYRGIDIGTHSYTRPCYEYLSSHFPGRLDLIIGDSRNELARFASYGDTDLIHIDGGHGIDNAEVDLCNVLDRAQAGTRLLFDDVNFKPLRILCDLYVMKGRMLDITPSIWTGDEQAVYRIF